MSIILLKMIALISMTIDHMGLFLFDQFFLFRIIGRISAPIFMFSSTEALKHINNKWRYIIRLYFFSIICAILQSALQIDNNFIRCLFETCVVIVVLENIKEKKYLFLWGAWQVLAYITVFYICYTMGENYITMALIPTIFGSLFLCEGGVVFIIIGIIFYYSKNKRELIFAYIMVCIVILFLTSTNYISLVIFYMNRITILGISIYLGDFLELLLNTTAAIIAPMNIGKSVLYENNQWLMIIAFPFFAVYNGKYSSAAKSTILYKIEKNIFYIYYPAHILVLHFISTQIIK